MWLLTKYIHIKENKQLNEYLLVFFPPMLVLKLYVAIHKFIKVLSIDLNVYVL